MIVHKEENLQFFLFFSKLLKKAINYEIIVEK